MLTILTTITNPHLRQDPWVEALNNFSDLADKVIVVDGIGTDNSFDGRKSYFELYPKKQSKIDWVYEMWPYEWSWEELPKHLNLGLARSLGNTDWLIRCDIDYLFHHDDFRKIRDMLDLYKSDTDVITFQKLSFTTIDRAYEKGPVPIALNLSRNDLLRFGELRGTRTDLCYPIVQEAVNEVGVPVGIGTRASRKSAIRVYNYDATFRTKAVQVKEFDRFSRAYQRYFGEYKFGKGETDSFNVFIKTMKARHKQCLYNFGVSDHPIHIQEKIKNINKSQFGYNGWGLL